MNRWTDARLLTEIRFARIFDHKSEADQEWMAELQSEAMRRGWTEDDYGGP